MTPLLKCDISIEGLYTVTYSFSILEIFPVPQEAFEDCLK